MKKNSTDIVKSKIRYILLYILFCLFNTTTSLIGQTITIKGHIELQDSISDIVYNVIALRPDSSIYRGNVFMKSDFSLEVDRDSLLCLRISSLGYEPTDYGNKQIISVAKNNIAELGNIQLKSNLSLKEITVTASRKNVSITPTGYSVDIKNSYLADYGTFDDVIKRIPGINVSPKGEIEVIGKSNLLYVLNGRILTSTDDLKRLEPQNIKSITIEQSPGPKYDASYDAVVNVETIDRNQEFYSLNAANSFEYARRPSNNTSVTIERKDKNLIYGLTAQYDLRNYKQYDTENKSVWENADTISTHRKTTLHGNTKTIGMVPTVQWLINDHNRIEAIYRLNYMDDHLYSDQKYTSIRSDQKNLIDTYLAVRDKKTSHNPSLYYIFNNDKHEFHASADYYVMNTDKTQRVNESYQSGDINQVNQDFVDKYEIYGGAIDYTTSLGNWGINAGGKLSGIKDDGRYSTTSESFSSSLLKDNTYAFYLGTSGSFSKFSFSAALRAEWNKVDYTNSSYETPVLSNYFNLFPSASIQYTHPSFTTSLTYNKRIRRPLFNELNPNKSYIDPVSYIVGNPLLKSRISDDFRFSFKYSDLVFIASYSIQHNSLAGVLEMTPDKRIAYTNLNIPEKKSIDLIAMYSFHKNWFRSNLAVQGRLQDIRFQDRVYSKFSSTPGLITRLNLDFSLWKNGGLNVIGYYYGNNLNNITSMKNTGYVSLEVSQSLCKNKWRLTAGVSDIFKTFQPNTWADNLSNARIDMDTDSDTRYFHITIQYRIGKMKPAPSSDSIISDEKNRL